MIGDGNKCRVDVLRGGEFLSGIFPHLDDSPSGEIACFKLDRLKAASTSPYTIPVALS